MFGNGFAPKVSFAPKAVNLTLKSKITGEGVLARRIYDKGKLVSDMKLL